MNRKIAFVFCDLDVAKIKGQDFDLFPLTSELKLTLSKDKQDYEILEDYFKSSERNIINDKASNWASGWSKGEDKIFKNLDLSMHNYFSKILFLLSCLDNLIDKQSVDLVFLGNENYKRNSFLVSNFEEISPLIKIVCKTKKIKFIYESRPSFKLLKHLVQLAQIPRLKRINAREFSNKPVIFASHHYHIKNCLTLLKRLNNSKSLTPLVIGRVGETKFALSKGGISYIDYQEEIEVEEIPRHLFFKIKLLLSLRKYIHKRRSFTYKNYELSEVFLFKIVSLFIYDGPRLKSSFETFRKLLRLVRPRILVVATNDSQVQVFIAAAKDQLITTVEIQHGITFGLDSVYSKADKFISWGEISKEIYNKTGILSQKIKVCGWPAFEVYKKNSINVRKSARRMRILFLAHDPQGMSLPFSTWSSEKSLRIFFESVCKMKNVDVTIRLHPRADENLLLATAEKYGVNFRLSKEESLFDALSKCDVVIGQTTSASVDALIMGKPLIYLPSMRFTFPFMENSGAAFEANSSHDLKGALRQIKSEGPGRQTVKNSKKFLSSYCNYNQDSIELIYKTIQTNARS